jgi:hypothetical protein
MSTPLLTEEDVAHERLERLIGSKEVRADDRAGDQDDDRALDDLGLARPFDLLQLTPRLADEPTALYRLTASCLTLLGLRRGPNLLLPCARALNDTAALGGLFLAAGAALRAGVLGHQRVSRCGVWRPHQRQYFLNSTRSGVFRFDFDVW